MKLTVAHKVIIGFTFITLLLLITSLFALKSFHQITYANTQVNQVAIPAQQQSNQTQIQLLQLARLTASGYNAEQQSDITRYQQRFEQEQQMFQQQLATLQQLDNRDSHIQQSMQSAAEHATQAMQATASMFSARLSSLTYQQKLVENQAILETQLEDAGNLLLELSELTLPRTNRATTEVIAGTATRLDGQLIGLLNTVKETTSYTEYTLFSRNEQNVSFALSDIQVNVDYLTPLASSVDTAELWPQFADIWQQITSQLQQTDNIVELKKQQLLQQQQARTALNDAEQQVEQALQQLAAAVNAANTQFDSLQQQLSSTLSTGTTRTWLIMLCLVVLAAATAYFTINAMLKPLTAINYTLGYIAQGDLTHKLTLTRQDEFGALASKVNSLIQALSGLLNNIQQHAGALRNTAHHSTIAVSDINQALQQQQQQISDVNGITQQLAATTSAIATHAADTDIAMQQALQQSQHINQLATANSERIDTLTVQLNNTSNLIDKVSAESTNIGSILTTINAIAEQTNLLALNAAIEAARAGEQGRGFAVVADEVRSLASRTQLATQEIRQMIEHLQQQTAQAVSAVQTGKTDAEACVDTMTTLLQALQEIAAAMSATLKISSAVNQASEQQLSLGSAITNTLHDMVALAKNSAAQAESTLQHSAEVETLAQQLQQAAAKFKT